MTVSVCVCDDMPDARTGMLRMLQTYEVRHDLEMKLDSVASGTELLSQIKKRRWDIVFLDIFMPGLDGIETARRLREFDRDCRIVFATATRKHAVTGYELNASGYLLKPVSQIDIDEIMDWYIFEYNSKLR